jgi:hypothetical protein
MTAPQAHPAHTRALLHAASPDSVTLALPGTDYLLTLAVYQQPGTPIGKRIVGTIHAKARRIDLVNSGGRYLEPVQGTPRRIQGPIIDVDTGRDTITIHAAAPIVCRLADPHQRADQFTPGDFVACDLLPGTSFTPANP